jgi:hypothetical protein
MGMGEVARAIVPRIRQSWALFQGNQISAKEITFALLFWGKNTKYGFAQEG